MDSESTRAAARDTFASLVPELSGKQVSAIEVGVWNWALAEATRRGNMQVWDDVTRDDYCRRAAHCAANLSRGPLGNGNGYLLAKVLEGAIEPYDVPFLDASGLNPTLVETLAAAKNLRDHHDMSQYEMASTIFECPSCGEKKSKFRQLQTRSGDEGSTLFLTCLACGHEWTDSP